MEAKVSELASQWAVSVGVSVTGVSVNIAIAEAV